MKTIFKKTSYLFSVVFISLLMIIFYSVFFKTDKATPDHSSITLTPFTANEQKELIQAQEQEEHLDVTGPLVASMTATDAQTRVLNLNHALKQSGNT